MIPLRGSVELWRHGSRAERLLLVGIVVLVLGMLITVGIAVGHRNDMDIYLAAAADMLAGENMYLKKYNTHYSYFYSPLFALLVSPLLLLPVFAAKILWALGSLLALARTFQILMRTVLRDMTRPQQLAVLFFALLFLFQAVRDNINSMQVTLLLVWLCIEGLHLIDRGKWIAGAALIGLGIDLKLIPLVLLPYLLWRTRWKAVLAACVMVVGLHVLPAAVLGWERNAELNQTRAHVLDPNDPRHVIDEEEPSFIALGSLLSAYLSSKGGNDHSLDLPRNFIELSVDQLRILLLLGRLLFIGLALYFLRWPLFRAAPSPLHAAWEISYLLLVCVLIFPHQRPYSMYLAAPAVLWLCRAMVLRAQAGTKGSWGLLVLCAVIYLFTNADLLLGEFSGVYVHYKLLSFMVIALVALLMWATPERFPVAAPEKLS